MFPQVTDESREARRVRNIRAPRQRSSRRLEAFGVATVHEAQGRTGLARPYLRPVDPGARIAGSAVTVLTHPGDNWMLHVAVEAGRAGDVLVVAMTRECRDGSFGELLATSLERARRARLVIDAAAATSPRAQHAFPVWSRSMSARGRSRRRSAP